MAQSSESPNKDFVESVRVKVPPFWPDEPTLWFAQLEGQFSLAGISADITKFNYIVANLEYKYIIEIKDIIKNPPPTDKYEKIKHELISRLSSSQEQRVRQLLTHEDVGDRKPSQFLRHLQGLAGPNVPDDFIRSLWSGRLPTHIQVIIASQPRSTLDELATLADTVNDVIVQPQVNEASANTNPVVMELKTSIAELTRQVAALTSLSSSRSRAKGRYGDRHSRSRSHSRDATVERQCWYHRRFKGKATKCIPPCSYVGNDKGSH